ncbi:Ras guanyl-releasing protein 3 [Triplophysa tibetana]|uniref:Ras guanyl-releasing protein 3 n=1 Tax=Triplophysa tibetana TaxID=1572043 RepID=A0A5A9NM53_9TELE|nr:Ras guanyl-releasing protein 3 [Triplophysa tibetana]
MGSFTLGKAASLELLLEACIQAFDDEGELHDNQLPRTLLLMHRWYWIAEFPAEFDLDLGLIRLTEEFRDAAQLGGDEHIKLLDISTIPSYDWMRKLTQRKKQVKKGKASLLFDHLEPIELAEHLTFLEYKSIRRISFTDYRSYVIHGCVVDNPTLERSIALFNGISQWVQLMVLSKLTPQHRAEVINKYIHVAQKLLHLQNFNTLMAVVGGLSHSSISRLKETHSHLSPEVTKIWNEMTELVSSNGNYCAYRKAFSECEGFKIPILGVHLKDLIAVHVVFPDWVEDGKVNIVKMQQLYLTFNELVSLQSAVSQVEPNMDLIYLLTLSLDLYYTEDEIYELSLLREPRNPKSQPTSPTTPTKPLAPLDWASGVTSKPDPSVVNKHIRKVVDSVFRNYDHDHDGYISQEDFESIAANFPFLDSFCVLDKDQDGLISKDEMMAYFLRANPLLQYCGVNCHKQCRELLVLACRRLPRSTSLGSVSPGTLTHSSLPSSPSLPTCKDDDEVFTFPALSPSSSSDLEGKSITLMTGSAQRISVRLQRATTSQATQTEPMWPENAWAAVADSGSHTFPKMRYRPHRKASKSKGFARWENDAQISTGTNRTRRESQEHSEVAQQNGLMYQHRDKTESTELTCPNNGPEKDALEPVRSADEKALLSRGHAGVPHASSGSGIGPLFRQPQLQRDGRRPADCAGGKMASKERSRTTWGVTCYVVLSCMEWTILDCSENLVSV